ncbi:SpoIIE family protein phosphatase [Puniceicoccaceae bacterium K14]|nr:SpoIIE family protein phosphatase [Puniceicoccaceae bacterium K14]
MSTPAITHTETAACEIAADLENVAKVASLLKHFCQSRGMDETLWPSIELGFCEGLNNAIEHGCDCDSSLSVKIKWKWVDATLQIEIEDPSTFEPTENPAELPEDLLADSGRGNFIIDSIFDSAIHESTDYGHRLRLGKKVHKPHDILAQMQGMYESLQTVTHDISLTFNKIEVLKNLTSLLSNESKLEPLIRRSIEQLSSLTTVKETVYWRHHKGLLKRAYKSNIKTNKGRQIDLKSESIEKTVFESNEISITEIEGSETSEFKILAPVQFQGKPSGLVYLLCSAASRKHLEDQVFDAIKVFANNLGVAQNQYRLYQKEQYIDRENAQMEVASEIQKSLLPSNFPQNSHCKLTGKCVTAMAVGGDYIDTIEVNGQGILIVIADVMGKGVPAAMLATIFRTAIRSRLNLAETPGWLLSKINKQIHEELGHLNMFITAQAAFYTYGKKVLKLASAGHCPALLLNSTDQSIKELTAEGIPLGIDASDIYEEQLFDMNAGDRVLFFTDGLYETENSSGEMLGIDRLSQNLPSLWDEGLEELPSRTLDFVSEFSSENTLQDDQTLIALEIL